MDLHTNINIISQEYSRAYKYFIDFMDESKFDEAAEYYFNLYNNNDGIRFVHQDYAEYEWYDKNSWQPVEITDDFLSLSTQFADEYVKLKKVRLQFPMYSLESDSNKTENYILEIYTYINGYKVVLGTRHITKKDSLTHKRIKRLGNEYYEYKDIWIIDPFRFCYGDEWAPFRQAVLGEPAELNNTGSLISFSLTPVDADGDRWVKSINTSGGANSVMLDTDNDDDMKLKAIFVNNYKYKPSISITTQFNPIYDSITEYLKETYNIDANANDVYTQWELVVKDAENIWKQVKTDMIKIDDDWTPTYRFTRDDVSFEDWSEFVEALEFKATLNFYYHKENIPEGADLDEWVPDERDDEYVLALYLLSNSVFITPDVFKFFIKDEIYDKKINYKNIEDMNVYKIGAVNKIEKKIINVERSDNYKSNIIRPVFFRTQQSGNIQIHTDANENIAINLDSYKSKVAAFRLRIEGIDFVEVGRNNSGVIFKITSSKLPKENYSGSYYIIDENNELVTEGKYEYI